MYTRTVSSQSFLDDEAAPLCSAPPPGLGFSSPPDRDHVRLPGFLRLCPVLLGLQAGLILLRLLSQLPR